MKEMKQKIVLRLWTYKNNALEALVRTTIATRVQEKISTPSQYKDGPLRYGDSHYKIRLSWDLPICIMRIPILVIRYLYIETTPRVLGQCDDEIFQWWGFPWWILEGRESVWSPSREILYWGDAIYIMEAHFLSMAEKYLRQWENTLRM